VCQYVGNAFTTLFSNTKDKQQGERCKREPVGPRAGIGATKDGGQMGQGENGGGGSLSGRRPETEQNCRVLGSRGVTVEGVLKTAGGGGDELSS